MALDYLKASDAAQYLGVTRQRIYELAATGRLGARLAGYWVFTLAELDAYRDERQTNRGGRPRLAAAAATAVPEDVAGEGPYLAAILRFAMIQRLPSGSFVGESLDFPGLSAAGATRAECEHALVELLRAAVADAVRAGAPLPEIDGVPPPRAT